jgi:CcmD family protein
MQGNYIVMAVTLTVWIGLFLFIMRLDRRVRKLEGKSR